jgi:hypothetical protein
MPLFTNCGASLHVSLDFIGNVTSLNGVYVAGKRSLILVSADLDWTSPIKLWPMSSVNIRTRSVAAFTPRFTVGNGMKDLSDVSKYSVDIKATEKVGGRVKWQ